MTEALLEKMYAESPEAKRMLSCSYMENDASNTLAAIASYFAEPSHNSLPTVDQLQKEEDLFTEFPVKITQADDGDIIVLVIDTKNRCSKGSVFGASMGGIRQWVN